MPLVTQSIAVSDQQDSWIKSQIKSQIKWQIKTGHYGNESERVCELVRERPLRDQETPAEIEAVRAARIEGEESGFSDRSVDVTWEDPRQRHRAKHG